MSKSFFNVGDKVKVIGKSKWHMFELGEIVEVIFLYDDFSYQCSNGSVVQSMDCLDIELVSSINNLQENNMSQVTWNQIPENLEAVINDNQKAFIKVGWMDTQLNLTSEGTRALLNILLKANEKELGVKAIAKMTKAEEESKE